MFKLLRKTKKDKIKDTAHSLLEENEAVRIIEATEIAQKRSHFRLECNIPAMIKLVCKNDLKQIVLGEPNTSTIINLSSGGARLITDLDLTDDDRFLISFKIDNDFIALTGEMKFKTRSLESDYQFEYGIRFTGTGTKDQDTICKFLFKEQMSSFS